MNTESNKVERQQLRRARVRIIVNERRATLDALREKLAVGLILANTARDSWALFLHDFSAPSKFRYQTFDAKGFLGHMIHNTLNEALEDAFQTGYRIPDEGALDRVACTEAWTVGMAIQAVRDRYNQGDITLDEMWTYLKEINSHTS